MTREQVYELVSISSRYDAYDNYKGYDSNVEEVIDIIYECFEKQLKEAQATIEALQAPKSCDGCKHQFMEEGDGLYHVYCGNCLRIHVDEYEPKDQQ